MSQVRGPGPRRFRCQVGLGKTAEVLACEQESAVDEALRVALSGQRVRLHSSSVRTPAMALHEPAANAVKYGALGQPEGRLAVT